MQYSSLESVYLYLDMGYLVYFERLYYTIILLTWI